ncbi:MAG: 4-hydroxy-tetrahydrodipicolinate synthase [Bacteroidales bacterium]|nr:4-hydroxy-tetrahydrodipicolinate synthase [Bacteroidales bacterium]MCF8403340.1 4-hydroxy-tetrahydrodipicolinate synthase [Bacteroidales bacterium]
MKEIKSGTGVALVTPFHNYGTIDFNCLEKLLNHVIEGGAEFVLALGTTSEAATLSSDEKNAAVNFIIETVNDRVPIMLGVGGNNTQEVVNRMQSINFDQISAVLSVAPYYNKPNQKGLYTHFKTIASACPLPLYLYNVPSRTSVNISAETTLKLATEIQNIVGIKEASGNMPQIMDIIKNKPKDFKVFSGDDALTLPMLSVGAQGVISVVANAYPKDYSEMVRLGLKGRFEEASILHYKLLDIIGLLFEDGNPAGVKAALEMLGICKNNLRLPLVKVNKTVNSNLARLIAEY